MPDQEAQSQPRSELASFGEELRREREIRGISLKEISDATKISKRFLEAIERNDHRTLPAPVFTRGFVREYARYLGLNSEDIVNRYNYAAAGDQHVEKTAHLERLVNPPPVVAPRPLPKRGIPPPYARIDRNVYILLVIVAALAGVSWWAIRHKKAESEAARAEAAAPPPLVAHAAAPPAAATQPPAKDDALRLVVELTGDSWLTLEADGTTVVNDELRAGERRNFDAKERFRFRTIGNAGGVTLTLNGTRLPPLGSEGKVLKNRVLDRQSLETLRNGGSALRSEASP